MASSLIFWSLVLGTNNIAIEVLQEQDLLAVDNQFLLWKRKELTVLGQPAYCLLNMLIY